MNLFLYYFTEIKAILIKKVHLKNFKYYASVVDINLEDVIHPWLSLLHYGIATLFYYATVSSVHTARCVYPQHSNS